MRPSFVNEMVAMRFLVLIILLFSGGSLYAQSLGFSSVDGLADHDFFEAFSVGDAVYIYRNSRLPEPENAIAELSKIISVDRAAIHGAPSKSDRAIINQMMGFETELSVQSVCATDFGEGGFLWRVEHRISPAVGGTTGAWPHFVLYVNPDGSAIQPDRYLCSRRMVASDTALFSVLSFEDLSTGTGRPAIDGEDALRIGRETIEAICSKASKQGLSIKTRFHDQRLTDVPIGTKNTGDIHYCRVWQVRFMLADGASFELFDNDPIVVWVTADGFASELSLEKWRARNRRTK